MSNLMQAIRANNERRIKDDPDYIFCPVPEAQSPYSPSAFRMPHRHDIRFIEGKDFCYMNIVTFNTLLEYSSSVPSGVWPGKLWKGNMNTRKCPTDNWYLRWWGEEVDGLCSVISLKIIIAEN
jgi:hypothetical protein